MAEIIVELKPRYIYQGNPILSQSVHHYCRKRQVCYLGRQTGEGKVQLSEDADTETCSGGEGEPGSRLNLRG